MRRKIKINSIHTSSASELGRLLEMLNVRDYAVIRKMDVPQCKADNIIMNLDDHGSGTHWVAMCRSKRMYFDSYGQPSPTEVPNGFKHKRKIIEGINDEDCGQLCALWLHYIHNKGESAFYNLFESLYKPDETLLLKPKRKDA